MQSALDRSCKAAVPSRKMRYLLLLFCTTALLTALCWVRAPQVFAGLRAVGVPSETCRALSEHWWWLLPLLVPSTVILVVVIAFSLKLWKLLSSFPDRPEAARSLQADLERARRALQARGFHFETSAARIGGAPTAPA